MSEPTIPDEVGLREGLEKAFALFAQETGLAHAVGETGVLRGTVEIFLEKGRGKHYKGSVSFERRLERG
jgi:urocanate hydratase